LNHQIDILERSHYAARSLLGAECLADAANVNLR
jgi:hypothetical protein